MSTEPCPYKSLVFFDIEGTGLPYEKPKITEISFIACSSSHFGESKRVPRVLHKLSLCRNPKKTIPPVVVGLTGLDNFLLEHESIFDKETIQLITKFFDQLQQPVCLIAHSGNAYDFPVLARHFTENDMFYSVKCVDSLAVFRYIENDEEERLEAFLKRELEEVNAPINIEESVPVRASSPDLFENMLEPHEEDDVLLTQALEKTECTLALIQSINESTPPVKTDNIAPPPPRVWKPKRSRLFSTESGGRRPVIPMKLTFSKSYKLTKIYERYFECQPENAHRAEDDAMMLLKCACFHSKAFLENIQRFEKDLLDFII